MSFKGEDTFIEENHKLLRERVTVFIQVTSVSNINLQPAYRLEHMIKTIKNLRFNPFMQENFTIYVLDDYAVHLMPEVRKALINMGIF